MLSQPVLLGEPSPDQSSCSSDTGAVLIRSTRVLSSDRRYEAGPGPGPGSLHITVQKLRDPLVQPPPAEQQQRSSRAEKQQQRPKPRQKPHSAAPQRAAGPSQPGPDLLTSSFAAGSRGVVLAALKQRSHSAPHRREVKVQLLDPQPLQTIFQGAPGPRASSQNAVGEVGVQTEMGLSSGCFGNTTNAATAATLTKVSQLTEGVEKLLQANREGQDRGCSLSQQTLHHLETLHSQQMQLQSQLLESALKMLTGQAPVTSDRKTEGQTHCLQVTHLDPLETADVLSNQKPSSLATRSATTAMETSPVAMATPRLDRWPEQTRDDWHHRGASVVTMTTQPAAGSHLWSSASHSQVSARANETLREMGRLKTEMKMLLTPEDSLKAIRSGLDHHQSQQNPSHPKHLQSQSRSQSLPPESQSVQGPFQQIQSKHNPSHPNHLQSHSQYQQSESQQIQSWSQQTEPQSVHGPFQQTQSRHNPSHPNHLQSHSQYQQSESQQTQSWSQQTEPQSVHGPFQQTQSKHNPSHPNHLQSHSQYQQSESQQTQSQSHQSPSQQIQSQQYQPQSQLSQQSLSVLVQRRPVVPSMLEEAGLVLRQVQRQKKVLEENLEALLRAKTGEVLSCQLEALSANRDWAEEVRIKRTVDSWISTLTKDIQAEMSSEDAVMTSQQRAAGSSAHTGQGRPGGTLTGPGLKTAARRGSRGPLQGAEPDRATGETYLTRLYGRAPYEGLRRTLKKSPYLRFSSPASPLSRKPRPRLVESVTGVKVKSCKTQTSLALPLTPEHHDTISPSHLTSGDPADITVTPAGRCSVTMAIPLGRPRRMDSSSRCLVQRQQEVTSPPTGPPTSSAVAVDDRASEPQSQREEQLDATPPPALPSPPPPPPPVDIIHGKNEEEDIFPGTNLLSVSDVMQQEEVNVVGEEAVELDGGPSPPPVLYQGPVFPPQPCTAIPVKDQASVLDLNLQRDTLENRLVEWVEQQLMSRMISEMYRLPPSDPTQILSTDQSESEEQSVTSDIVEAAGGGGLQFFVDSNTSVDSALIRQLVSEVLTEHVALMLGHRDSLETGPEPASEPPEPGPGAPQEDKPVPLIPTPVPTPPPSPALPSTEIPPLTTPPPSEPTSLLNDESLQPITAPEPVTTPISSAEPTHSERSFAESQAVPPVTWGDTEQPLDEERPEEHLDTCPQPLVMSVVEEEPPLSSPLPPLSIPPPPPPPPPPPSGPVSPSTSSEEDSSTSSTTVTTLRHISEGELLLPVHQLAAMTGEESVLSVSSSLQELLQMDFDPPSEGQVRGHDLLMMKMEQRDTHPPRGQRPQPEGCWGSDQEEEVSAGEVRDNQTTKPHRTTNSKSPAVLNQTFSPRQISQAADVSEVSFEATNQSSVAVGDLMEETFGMLTSDLQNDLLLTPTPPLYTCGQVLPVRPAAEEQQGGTRIMEVHLPSITPQEEEEHQEEVMEEEVSVAADPDSSSNDVF